jgi:acyl carrier protein
VTGGTGLLGSLVAKHLAATGRAGCLVLASRSGPAAPGSAALAAAVAAAGAGVVVTACDAADRGALAGLLASLRPHPPLTGIIHAAGVLDDGVIESLTAQRIDAVMRPKADAAWNLHELTAGAGLRDFVLFSAGAATFGAAGQGNYAAANSFLDALAATRRAQGRPAVSLAWGLWADASAMTGHLGAGDKGRISRGGMTALSAADGLALLDRAMERDEPLLVPARIDVAGLRARAARGEPVTAVWHALAGAPARAAVPAAGLADSLRQQLAGLPPADAERLLLGVVCAHVAAVLGLPAAGAVDGRQAFKDLGFDSLTALELRNRLGAATGLRLPATLIFDYPTPAVLAARLVSDLAPGSAPADAGALDAVAKLEAAVATLAAADGSRAVLAARLTSVLAVLERAKDSAADSTDADGDLAAATAESIFDLLDNELTE